MHEMTGTVTRQRDNLYIPKVNTNAGTKMITVRGPQVRNQIPAEIRNTASFSKFNDRLKKFMLGDFNV